MAVDVRTFPQSTASDFNGRSTPQASAPSLRSRNSVYLPMAATRTDSTGGGGNVKVVVRVRGFLPREINRGAQCLIEMDPRTEETTLHVPSAADPANARTNTRKLYEKKSFTFDKSFWSHDRDDAHYSHQEDVYNSLGEEYLDHNFEGYHTCIFAYGQTGSGKSYTMMGTPDQPGLIPRTCQDLFERIETHQTPDSNQSFNVRVSYFEVYNEHVRDLLAPRTDPPTYLKIRESPSEGPYIVDLTDQPVRNYADIERMMKLGDINRTTAATKMNDTSSRSHAVFTIMLKQMHVNLATDETTERMARIRLVDLAGSERAKATEATGARLREGSNINKSLTTLGRVIAALASDSKDKAGSPRKRPKEIVPYRDSILTWLLKDSLGGNSKTAMIACISPSDYDETLSTLRYADQAKKIRTRAIVNQDHSTTAERDAQMQVMQETIKTLQISVSQQAATKRENDLQCQQLEEYKKQVEKMQQLMEETKQISEAKIRALTTENDALRLHLKLAVERFKNPAVVVTPAPAKHMASTTQSATTSPAPQPVVVQNRSTSREPLTARTNPPAKLAPATDGPDESKTAWDEGSDTDVDAAEAEAMEVQAEVRNLLKDLGMFKRKLDDDKSRFIKPVRKGRAS